MFEIAIERFDLLFETALLLGVISFCLAVYVLAKSPFNKLHLSYLTLTGAISVWAFSFVIAGVLEIRAFESTHIITTLLLSPISLLFMQVLLRPEDKFYRWCTVLTFLVSIIFIPLVSFGLDTYAWIRDVSYFSPILIICAVLYLYISETLGVVKPRGYPLTKISRRDWVKALRIRNMWLYLGGIFVTITCVMDRVPWMGRTIPSLGNLFLAVYIYGLKDIVLGRGYVSIRRFLGRIVSDAGTALVLTGIYLLVSVWVTHNFLLYTLNIFLAAYIGIYSAGPVRSLLNVFYQKFFFKEATQIEILVEKYSEKLSLAFDAYQLSEVIQDFLFHTIQSNRITFYALSADGKKYEKFCDHTNEETNASEVSVTHPFIYHWQKVKEWKPILLTEMRMEIERSTASTEHKIAQQNIEAMQRFSATLAFPLLHEQKVVGLVVTMGENRSILPLLEPFFRNAAEALVELDVYESLRERERLAVLGEMSAGLAHEIRNPLGAIKGAAQVLELQKNDNKEQFLNIIIEEVNRLNKVVTQFLDYSKPFQGKAKSVSFSELVQQTITRFQRKRESLGEKIIPIVIDLAPAIPHVQCQEELIEQIITNLIENAYHAMEEMPRAWEENKIIVRLVFSEKEDLFSVEVEDNGPGMKKEYLEKVFIPFFSLSKNGTGLGLSICQKIAEAHGGKIILSSKESQGTIARLQIPHRNSINEKNML